MTTTPDQPGSMARTVTGSGTQITTYGPHGVRIEDEMGDSMSVRLTTDESPMVILRVHRGNVMVLGDDERRAIATVLLTGLEG